MSVNTREDYLLFFRVSKNFIVKSRTSLVYFTKAEDRAKTDLKPSVIYFIFKKHVASVLM